MSEQKQNKAKETITVKFNAPKVLVLQWIEDEAKSYASMGKGTLVKMVTEKDTYAFEVEVQP
jgi:hypothetical protein